MLVQFGLPVFVLCVVRLALTVFQMSFCDLECVYEDKSREPNWNSDADVLRFSVNRKIKSKVCIFSPN